MMNVKNFLVKLGCSAEICGDDFHVCLRNETDPRSIVHCNSAGDVVALNLDERGLIGYIDETELQTLTKLQRFVASDNFLFGSVPPSFSLLSALWDLNVKNNSFHGDVLHLLSSMPNLKRLQAYDNFFTDRFDDLRVADNNSLELLSISDNEMVGKFSSELGKLNRLTYLHGGSNRLGELPSEFYALTQLRDVNLFNNNITGTLSWTIGEMKQLESLVLLSNFFTSSIPTTIGECRSLTALDLGANAFNASLPSQLARRLTLLQRLFVQDNNLTGTLPFDLFGSLKRLDSIRLFHNALVGPLGNIKNTVTCDLQRNDTVERNCFANCTANCCRSALRCKFPPDLTSTLTSTSTLTDIASSTSVEETSTTTFLPSTTTTTAPTIIIPTSTTVIETTTISTTELSSIQSFNMATHRSTAPPSPPLDPLSIILPILLLFLVVIMAILKRKKVMRLFRRLFRNQKI